ncbi:MAG TPA: YceI family protein [Gammaproteobacteria bacterium]|nr:YceI family protein [Gammaproteobacteria bacterium]
MSHAKLFLALAFLSAGAARADCWKPVPAPKSLSFNASQAGAPFPGEFKSYSALLCLDAKDPSRNRLQVQVDMNSVSTDLPEMDDALKGGDFFDTAHWPQAKFESDSLTLTAPGQYKVSGKLTVRDTTRSVSVPFTWTPAADGKSARLTAKFTLQRLDYGIGRGQWADTQWVGNPVDLAFAINFVPATQ